ncbi:MAG: FAD-binding protein [Chloroflexi bacterium]|nr:FAD-binding protein [Chloroflexota bacterium]
MPASRALIADLCAVLPRGRVLTEPEDLLVHGYDGTWLDQTPDVVVAVTSTEEIAAVLRIARRHQMPVIPRGGGSGLAGGAVPHAGGIVLSTTLMHHILALDAHSLTAVVQPGVVNAALQAAAERHGLFYPPDPASLNQATIGGNVATSASGPRCLKYGGTKDYVIGLEVVLPDGDVVRLGGRSHQPGPDHHLLRLFVGSEGTLGVISEVTVRLLPKPAARGTVMAAFDHLEEAARAVGTVLSGGILPLALEMMDQITLRCVEEYLQAGLPTESEAVLLIDVDGDEMSIPDQLDTVVQACRSAGATIVEPASSEEDSARLWRARRSTSSSFGRIRPNKLGEDISVPRSAIPAMVRAVQEIAARYNLLIPLFGHIGDGNLHPNILCDLRDAAEMERVALAAREIFAEALRLGGTLSGEHGIGLLKRAFMPASVDSAALALMRQIKRTLDPDNLLNPGKLLSDVALSPVLTIGDGRATPGFAVSPGS